MLPMAEWDIGARGSLIPFPLQSILLGLYHRIPLSPHRFLQRTTPLPKPTSLPTF
jgi:hypothetical protein